MKRGARHGRRHRPAGPLPAARGFLYTDVLTGRWKRRAKKEIKHEGWTVAGITWTPGVDEDPFGHDEPDSLDKGREDDA